MKINGKSIIGFYRYSDNAEYDKGDFVVKGDCIYICTAQDPTDKENFRVTGKDPSVDHVNFKIYPGEMISSAEEYFEYAAKVSENEQPEDKYISMHTLYEILQRLYFGVSTSGVIYKNASDYSDIPEDGLENVDEDPLGNILTSRTLNNGVLKVSREVFNGVLGKVAETAGSNFWSELSDDGSMVILRQYTYDFENNKKEVTRRRTQELVDPVTGIMLIRFLDGTEDGFNTRPVSAWRCISLGLEEKSLKSKLDSIINGALNAGNNYQTAVINFEKSAFINRYSYSESSVEYLKSDSVMISAPESGNRVYQVVLSIGRVEGENYGQNFNFTFDYNELGESGSRLYIIDRDYCHAWVHKEGTDGKYVTILLNSLTDTRGVRILNVYSRDDK